MIVNPFPKKEFFAFAILVCFMIFATSIRSSAKDLILNDVSINQQFKIATREIKKDVYFSFIDIYPKLHITLDWDYVSGIAEIRFKDHIVKISKGSPGFMLDGKFVRTQGKVIQDGSAIWMPLDYLHLLFEPISDGSLYWDPGKMLIRFSDINKSAEREIPKARKRSVIVVDAGHGGEDNGCKLPNGNTEKDITRKISDRIGLIIQDRLGAEIVYTRSGDYYVTEKERIGIANKSGADLLISLHIAPPEALAGKAFFVYTPKFLESDPEAKHGLPLWSHVSSTIAIASKSMGNHIGSSVSKSASNAEWELDSPEIKLFQGLAIPGVQIELSWLLTCYGDSALDQEAGQNRVAEAIFDGIKAAIEMEKPDEQ
jgi:N-acetylmuramoyl-L-alanine amidase